MSMLDSISSAVRGFLANSEASRFAHDGIALSKAGRYDDAVPLLRKAVDLNDSDGNLHYHLGMAYFGKESYRDAGMSFEMALMRSPMRARSYFTLGYCYFRSGSLWKALNCYLAHLDFREGGEADTHSREMVAALNAPSMPDTFDERVWIDTSRQTRIAAVQGLAESYVPTVRTAIKESNRPEKVILNAAETIAAAKIDACALSYLGNGKKLGDKGLMRAALVQMILGVQLQPNNQLAIAMLAFNYATVGEYSRGARIAKIVDTAQVGEETRTLLQKLLDTAAQYD